MKNIFILLSLLFVNVMTDAKIRIIYNCAVLEKQAESGDADAQNTLGSCYYTGNGITQDYEKAVYWYTKAAEQGFAIAQYNLGKCYENGEGVSEDMEKAVDLYYKAAEQEYAPAQYAVGMYGYRHSVESVTISWLEKAAEQDYEPAQLILGSIYYQNSLVEHDYEKSVHYLLLVKDSQDTETSGLACYILSKCYRFGRGVEQDVQKADELLHEAGQKGCDEAKSVFILKKKLDGGYEVIM